MTGGHQIFHVVDGNGVNPLGGQHPPTGPFPVHFRHDIEVVVPEIAVQFRGGGTFHAQIHFPPQAGGKGLDSCNRLETPQARL